MPRSDPDPILRARAAENFPVASWLIDAGRRPFVHAFYRVVRGADDIADSPALAAEAKLDRLRDIDGVLAGVSPAAADPLAQDADRLRALCLRHALDLEPARQMLQAFAADAANRPCRTWSDLLAYCRYSAVPVGRFLLDLHGESTVPHRASDALCTALQILNHLQDCAEDWRRLRRCYLPTVWLEAEGVTTAARESAAASAGLRRVLDRILDHLEPMLREAERLPSAVSDPGLAREAAGIVALARSLARRLRATDPLRGRVAASSPTKVAIFLTGALAHRPRRRRASPSSFRLAIRLFPPAARPIVGAVYALARRLDDIADGMAPSERKRAAFAAWRTEIAALYGGTPSDPLTIPLLSAVPRLPQREWLALIDGLEMDTTLVRIADEQTLALYCRRVAGTIGVLVLAACGHTGDADEQFAVALGEALQRVNILRDVDEDLSADRLYLPAESLQRAGIDPSIALDRLRHHAGFGRARAQFIIETDAAFAVAASAAAGAAGARVFAVRLIGALYRRLFQRLTTMEGGSRPRLGWRDQALAVLAAVRGR